VYKHLSVKKIIGAVVLVMAIGGGVGYYMWNKPRPKVEDAKGIEITATQLAKEYTADENTANTKYLSKDHDKAIEVSGTVSEMEKNQDGGFMVVLQTEDPMVGVQCAMRDKNTPDLKGKAVKIKGYCSGNGITGVSLTDCIIVP